MLDLFRKVRRRLASENKFKKYSRYALGEIMLVVIGIIIALQLNNWNEERKLKKEEIGILEDLHQVISSDIIKMKELTQLLERKLNYLKVIKRELQNENNLESDSMRNAFSFALQTEIFTGKPGPYEVLKFNGFKIISNDSLRVQIIDLYEGIYKWVESDQSNKFIDDTYFSEYSLKYFDNIVYADTIKPNIHYYREIKPHDFEALRNDKIYITLINSKVSQEEYVINFVYGTALIKMEEIINHIKMELERHKD